MDVFLIIAGSVLLLTGIVGSILPVLPGLPVSWLGLLLLKFTGTYGDNLSWKTIIWTGVATLVITLIDNFLPVLGTKKYGGGKKVIIGASLGLLFGFAIGPIGIFAGPFIGALIGGLIEGQRFNLSFKQALGTFAGFFIGIVLKLFCGGFLAWVFIKTLL